MHYCTLFLDKLMIARKILVKDEGIHQEDVRFFLDTFDLYSLSISSARAYLFCTVANNVLVAARVYGTRIEMQATGLDNWH